MQLNLDSVCWIVLAFVVAASSSSFLAGIKPLCNPLSETEAAHARYATPKFLFPHVQPYLNMKLVFPPVEPHSNMNYHNAQPISQGGHGTAISYSDAVDLGKIVRAY